jgi:hypothetical protein
LSGWPRAVSGKRYSDRVAQRTSEREAVWSDQNVLLGDRQGVEDAVEAVRKVQQHVDELRTCEK